MAASKFTADVRGAVLADIEAGATLEEAARNSQLRLGTLKHWLWRGRREDSGEYPEFAAAVDRARAVAASREEPGTRDELVLEVWRAVKHGSVRAMKLYEEITRDKDEPQEVLAGLDALGGPDARGA